MPLYYALLSSVFILVRGNSHPRSPIPQLFDAYTSHLADETLDLTAIISFHHRLFADHSRYVVAGLLTCHVDHARLLHVIGVSVFSSSSAALPFFSLYKHLLLKFILAPSKEITASIITKPIMKTVNVKKSKIPYPLGSC